MLNLQVSVPLRGLWFLSRLDGHFERGEAPRRFRPLAGIMVLIKGVYYVKDYYHLFPSPYGDYGSYLENRRVNT